MVKIGNHWDHLLKDEWEKPYYQKIRQFLIEEYSLYDVYPKKEDIFQALKLTDYDDAKVIILGQDPYHNPGQANGLAFSVNRGVRVPPSLVNIYKELHRDIGFEIPSHGDLTELAKRGVLLLNTSLTVRAHRANSHANIGWQILTDRIIEILGASKDKRVFMLWGANARKKKHLINEHHLVLEAVHPSPLSAHRGFIGCAHFSKANDFIFKEYGYILNWTLSK